MMTVLAVTARWRDPGRSITVFPSSTGKRCGSKEADLPNGPIEDLITGYVGPGGTGKAAKSIKVGDGVSAKYCLNLNTFAAGQYNHSKFSA